MFSLRWLGLFVVLSTTVVLSACGGGGDTPLDSVPSEPISEDGSGTEPAGLDGDGTSDTDGTDGTESASGEVQDPESSDSDSATDEADVADPDPVNRAPEISGTPSTEVTENSEYQFTPTASDADGDDLFFRIENRPTWAQWDDKTGTLSGTPDYTDVGTTNGVVISVTDGVLTTALEAFDLTVIGDGIGNGTAAISWTPPTTRTDGSALTDLSGYRIHYGQQSGEYSEIVEVGPGNTAHVIEQLDQGQWYFTMTALDGEGLESEFSEEDQKLIAY